MSRLDEAIQRCQHLKSLIQEFEDELKQAPEYRIVFLKIAIQYLKRELTQAGQLARHLEN